LIEKLNNILSSKEYECSAPFFCYRTMHHNDFVTTPTDSENKVCEIDNPLCMNFNSIEFKNTYEIPMKISIGVPSSKELVGLTQPYT